MTAMVTQTRWGPMLVPPHDSYVGRSLVEYGEYCPVEFAAWAPYIPVGGVVVEAGANLGGHTMAFAHAVGRMGEVYAIEPQRQIFQMLSGSLALCDVPQVWGRWCALGRENGVVFVPPLDYTLPNNFGGLELAGQVEGEPVAKVRLDEWQLPRVDFFKIDVEGMELDVLRGAQHTIATTRPVIAVEADRHEHYAGLVGWLLDHHYDTYLQCPLLGAAWPDVRSKNVLALPKESHLPAPTGNDVSPLLMADLLQATVAP